jgi:hypothetical protein
MPRIRKEASMSYNRPKVERVQLLGQMQAAPSICGPKMVFDKQLGYCVYI